MASSFVVPSLSRSSQTDEKAVVVQMDPVASRRRPSPAETNELLVVLGIPVYKLSPLGQFLTLCSGILLFYLLYGYVQEWIFRTEGLKPFGLYLTLVQFGFYTIFGSVEFRMREDATRRIPLRTYTLLAFLTVSTMGLSNASLGYLNYPTQVIFKCCKLIPVMIGGIFIQNKRYGMIDFSAVVCMSAGLVLFTLADSSVSPNFDKTGVVFISSALCADAIIGNVQEKTMKAYSASNTEVVLYSYGIGFIYLLFCLVLNGGLVDAFRAYAKNPLKTYGLAAVFSITGYLGILFVLALVRSFGALLAVTVTTFRKAISIILSFLFFTKPFTLQYIWSGLVILLGIALNVYSKNYAKINAFFSSKHRSASQSV